MNTGIAARLGRTVLYQIYPQSFADANGDGVGDVNGITQRLDYLEWLGVDAIWLNPCFVSPFADAGYDVADYLRVAPCYGTNDDLAELCAQAARRGISVILDLVAGHTSDRHPWFTAACAAAAPAADRDRYIWRSDPAQGWHRPREATDAGYYLPNFFPVQPALNYGYARSNPDEPWRQPVDAPGPLVNRAALREIMSAWFDLGVSGFRVDMASSLVKDDPGFIETVKLWRQLRGWIDTAYPGHILIAEWGDPAMAVPAGFHVDFFLHFGGRDNGLAWRSLFNNNAGTLDPLWNQDVCWAGADASGDARTFVDSWSEAAAAIGAGYGRGGIAGLPSANHDVSRLVCGPRDRVQARVPLALLFTWPILPSLYYGDEIGMRYLPGTPTRDGSRLGPTYDRAGSRTPMPWGDVGAGSTSGRPADSRYLPTDPDADAPTVASALVDPGSPLHLVRALIQLRHQDPRLDASAPVDVLSTGYPFAYTRGEDASLLVALNPGRDDVVLPLASGAPTPGTVLIGERADLTADSLRLGGFGFAVVDRCAIR